VMEETNQYTLRAGNYIKREMKGNQQYFNYERPAPHQQEFKHSIYSNNFEISQNGFPNNSYKVLNGTNTMFPKEGLSYKFNGMDDEFAKVFTNEIVFNNGGSGDTDNLSAKKVTYYDPAISGGVNGTPMEAFKSSNSFNMVNGANAKTTMEVNNVYFNNGFRTKNAYNNVIVENGHNNLSGANIVRVENKGSSQAEYLTNSITLDNDNELASIVLSDYYNKDEKPNEPINVAVSQYSSNLISNRAAEKYTVDSKYGHSKFSTSKFDADSHTSRIQVREDNIDTWSAYTNSTEIDGKDVTFKAETLKTDSNSYSINSDNITMTGTDTSILGKAITINAGQVNVNKLDATGTLRGHLEGSMNGIPMMMGFICWPSYIRGTNITVASGPVTNATPSAPTPPVTNDVPMIVNNEINPYNEESKSLKIKSILNKVINKFVSLELSLFNVMNGNAEKK